MKKITRRIFALTLTLAMLFAMMTVASASTVTWDDGNGGKTLVLTVSGTSTQQKAISGAPTVYHSSGTANTISYSGSISTTAVATKSASSTTYLTYIQKAMSAEGMYMTYTASGNYTGTKTISAARATGSYTLAVVFTCKNARWSVDNGIIVTRADAQPASVASGTITYAPTGAWTIDVISA